jgi:endonuclease YncB( thermonuclease family)
MLRRIDGLLATLLIVSLALTAFWLKREPETLGGGARVIDGDTIELAGRRLRLVGIDAPELGQTCERAGQTYRCGEAARDGLRELVAPGLSCRISGQDRYRRDLATCEADGEDPGRVLVARGLAVAFGRYESEEREARRRGVGLWAGSFERPSEWRKAHPR